MALRSLLVGVGFKPASAAEFKRLGSERLVKKASVKKSGEFIEDERK